MSGVFAAFVYLSVRSTRNRLGAQVRQLRSPRYVLAVAVAIGYFVLLLYHPTQDGLGVPAMLPSSRSGGLAALELLSACGLALFTAKWWLIGSTNSTLAFSAAEVQFLFPAPLRRRTLVLYKIGRTQLSLVISALLVTFLARRAGAHLSPLLRAASLWILFCTLSLHQMAAALVRTGAAQRGRGLRRNAVPIVVAGSVLLVLLVTAVRAWPGAMAIGDVPGALTRVSAAFSRPIPNAVLAPFRLVVAPSYAETTRAWLLAIGPALAVLVFHMVWVLRADAVFEDAAVEASARRADRIAVSRARAAGAAFPTPSMVDKVSGSMAAVRLDRAPPPAARLRRAILPLDPTGDPSIALLWKNSLALIRGLRLRTVLFVSVSLGAVVIAFRELGLFTDTAAGGGVIFLGAMALMAALFLVILGPLAIRNDLRQDLLHIDVLRTYPLTGPSLVFAEVASSTLALTLVQWVLLITGYVLLASGPTGPGDSVSPFETPFADRATMLAICIATLPVINGASFLVQNSAALLFPAWIRLGASGMGGLEVIGQRILGIGASLLGLGLLLVLPTAALFAVLITWQGDAVPTALALLLSVAVGIIVAAMEIGLGIHWLGRRFERTDAADILPQNNAA